MTSCCRSIRESICSQYWPNFLVMFSFMLYFVFLIKLRFRYFWQFSIWGKFLSYLSPACGLLLSFNFFLLKTFIFRVFSETCGQCFFPTITFGHAIKTIHFLIRCHTPACRLSGWLSHIGAKLRVT